MRRIGRAFRLALGFLTILPVGTLSGEVSDADLARSRLFYPVVGGLIGGLMALVSLGLSRAGVSEGVAAWGLVAIGALLSGGLHLDGLADTFDGLFLPGGPERRLGVMRDPRAGSHGVAAVVLVVIGKVMALQGMDGPRRATALLGAMAIGRTLLLLAAGSARYARPEGTGRAVIGASGPGEAVVASLAALGLGATSGARGVLGGLVAIGVVSGLARLASRRLGGTTGDILGAGVELSELAFLIVAA